MPKHLAEKILTSRSALEGGAQTGDGPLRDVKDSMNLAEQVDPEEAHKIMDRFFTILLRRPGEQYIHIAGDVPIDLLAGVYIG
jgi:hypothetical protein